MGRYFPDTDPAFRDASSRQLLEATVALVLAQGFSVASADVTIIAERPRLAIYMPAMSQALSGVVGALGRAEGIGASAVVLLDEPA
jgi:2-C-methyl-D-erythritol 2,4-cyclodiphosphate synthase